MKIRALGAPWATVPRRAIEAPLVEVLPVQQREHEPRLLVADRAQVHRLRALALAAFAAFPVRARLLQGLRTLVVLLLPPGLILALLVLLLDLVHSHLLLRDNTIGSMGIQSFRLADHWYP